MNANIVMTVPGMVALLRGEVAWSSPGTPLIYSLVSGDWFSHLPTWRFARDHEVIEPAQRDVVRSKMVVASEQTVMLRCLPPRIGLWEAVRARYLVCLPGRPTYTRADTPILFYYDFGSEVAIDGNWIEDLTMPVTLASFNPQAGE